VSVINSRIFTLSSCS